MLKGGDTIREHSQVLFWKTVMGLSTFFSSLEPDALINPDFRNNTIIATVNPCYNGGGTNKAPFHNTLSYAVKLAMTNGDGQVGGNGDTAANNYENGLRLIHLGDAIANKQTVQRKAENNINSHIKQENAKKFKLLMRNNHPEFAKTIDNFYNELDPFTLKYLNKLLATAIPFISQLKLYGILLSFIPKFGGDYSTFYNNVMDTESGNFQRYDDYISADLQDLLVKYEKTPYFLASEEKAKERKKKRYEKQQLFRQVLKDSIAGQEQKEKAKKEYHNKEHKRNEKATEFAAYAAASTDDDLKDQNALEHEKSVLNAAVKAAELKRKNAEIIAKQPILAACLDPAKQAASLDPAKQEIPSANTDSLGHRHNKSNKNYRWMIEFTKQGGQK